MAARRVLIVDSPVRALWSLAAQLRAAGLDVHEVTTTEEALASAGRGAGVLVLHQTAAVDLDAVVRRAHELDSGVSVLGVTDPAEAGVASTWPQAGITDTIGLPCDLSRLSHRVTREVENARHRQRLLAARLFQSNLPVLESLIGDSAPIAHVRVLVRKLAASQGVPGLITGEPGTGRALVARAIHDTGHRAAGPFVRVDCTPARHDSLETVLLGSEQEAGQRPGAVELAEEGTLFLENVERLPDHLQVAVLRMLETRTFRRAGGDGEREVDLRVLASTGSDVHADVDAGRFRADLHYRLAVVRIDAPSLRERGRDVLQLADHFAAQEGIARRQMPVLIDDDAHDVLLSYDWPGNTRELRHVIERAVLVAHGERLTCDDFRALDRTGPSAGFEFVLPRQGVNLETLERRLVIEALTRTGGNQTRAAQLLGLHRDQIRYRIVKYGLRS